MRDKVTVTIPVYNRSGYILEAIRSVLDQNYADTEIIIVDDGSTDDTRERLAFLIKNGIVRYLYQENRGRSAARNKGISLARGTGKQCTRCNRGLRRDLGRIRDRCQPGIVACGGKEKSMQRTGTQNIIILPLSPHRTILEFFGRAPIIVGVKKTGEVPDAILEAMTTAAFPIQPDTESTAEWLTHGVNGLLIDPRGLMDIAVHTHDGRRRYARGEGCGNQQWTGIPEAGCLCRKAQGD
jgi:hypothetical protein